MSGYSHQRRQSPTRPARRSEYSDTIDVDEYHGSEAGQYPDEIDDEGSEDGGSASIDPSPATAPHDQPAYAYAENRDRDEYRRGRVYVNVTPSSVPTRNQRVHPGVSIRPRQIRYSHVRADETQFSFRRRSLPPRRDLSPLPPLPRENTFRRHSPPPRHNSSRQRSPILSGRYDPSPVLSYSIFPRTRRRSSSYAGSFGDEIFVRQEAYRSDTPDQGYRNDPRYFGYRSEAERRERVREIEEENEIIGLNTAREIYRGY